MSLRPLLRATLASALLVAGCEHEPAPSLAPLKEPVSLGGAAGPRVSGDVGTPEATPPAQFSYGVAQPLTPPSGAGPVSGGGDISLDFADTDIREVTAQILGNILHLTYTIDPAVKGTATLRTATPMTRGQLIPVLEALLAQNGATLVQSGAVYRVVPAAAATTGAVLAGGSDTAGAMLIPLRYASADDLARVLQPYVGTNARVVPDGGRNALLVTGDPAVRESIVDLVRAFDIDVLAGQSYALLPVTSGDAKDFASALQTALRGQSGGALAGQIRVLPLDRMSAVMVIASQRRLLDDAERVYTLVQRNRRDTIRSWHVVYLQNSRANDIAYVLQQAFTPGDVTAQPSQSGSGQTAPGARTAQFARGGQSGGLGSGSTLSSGAGSLTGGGGTSPGSFGLGSGGAGATLGGANPLAPATGGSSEAAAPAPAASANPLLGGLDQSGNASADMNTMRIIPNPQNNALLIYATGREEDTLAAMLRKIDILPLQVRIDATIAEVDLNDALQYGTQFFFKSGGINGALNNISATAGSFNGITSIPLGTSFPGFVIGSHGAGGAPFAISALQAVTTVHVLSSPEILVLDNQPARLQVGDLVPYLLSSQQSTLTSNAPVVNSIGYQPTGVIMQVTPRVNSGGLVTLDISQEVSNVNTAASTTTGINSPTFSERNVTSRVVVQDGQTVGLAGLINDSETRGNSGIPWLKDIPLLGALAGTQNNSRVRTELLVLITPHVLHDQRDARALTEDLRDELINAAGVRSELQSLPATGSADPNLRLRRSLGGQ